MIRLQYKIKVHCQNDHITYVNFRGSEEEAEFTARVMDGRQKAQVTKPGICPDCRAPFFARVEEVLTSE